MVLVVLVVPRVAGEALMDELAGACIELEHAIYGRCASHCFARMDEEDEGLSRPAAFYIGAKLRTIVLRCIFAHSFHHSHSFRTAIIQGPNINVP